MPESWHTKAEKRLIKEFGGEPQSSFGVDGTIDGDPVEVRVARKEDRFRINCGVHDTLMSEGGSYILDDVTDDQPPKEVPASRVDGLLPEGDCHSDRGYKHQFIGVSDIF